MAKLRSFRARLFSPRSFFSIWGKAVTGPKAVISGTTTFVEYTVLVSITDSPIRVSTAESRGKSVVNPS